MPGVVLYRSLAVRMLKPFHRFVARELCRVVGKGVVLDVGCGTCSLLIELIRSCESVYGCIGIDLSVAMAKTCRDALYRSGVRHLVDVVVGDAHRMPVRSRSVDAAVSTGTLHHLLKPRAFFEECSRVVKSVCVVYEFSHDAPSDEVKAFARGMGRSWRLLKLVASMHGIPRRDFVEGVIARELRESGVRYGVSFVGLATKLEIFPRG